MTHVNFLLDSPRVSRPILSRLMYPFPDLHTNIHLLCASPSLVKSYLFTPVHHQCHHRHYHLHPHLHRHHRLHRPVMRNKFGTISTSSINEIKLLFLANMRFRGVQRFRANVPAFSAVLHILITINTILHRARLPPYSLWSLF